MPVNSFILTCKGITAEGFPLPLHSWLRLPCLCLTGTHENKHPSPPQVPLPNEAIILLKGCPYTLIYRKAQASIFVQTEITATDFRETVISFCSRRKSSSSASQRKDDICKTLDLFLTLYTFWIIWRVLIIRTKHRYSVLQVWQTTSYVFYKHTNCDSLDEEMGAL